MDNPSIEEKCELELVLFSKEPSLDMIIDNIYVGNYAAGLNFNILKEKSITHILIAAKHLEGLFINEFKYKIIPLYDSEYTNIAKLFDESNIFIHEGSTGGNSILVHCGAGISRSVSLVIAYMIYSLKMSYSEAITLFKEKRKIAKPNSGFEKQLRNYSYELYKKF